MLGSLKAEDTSIDCRARWGATVSTLTAGGRKKRVWINWRHLIPSATSGGNGREENCVCVCVCVCVRGKISVVKL